MHFTQDVDTILQFQICKWFSLYEEINQIPHNQTSFPSLSMCENVTLKFEMHFNITTYYMDWVNQKYIDASVKIVYVS